MRAPRAYLAGFGTSGSLLAGAALLFILASAFIGFHGWPQVGDSPSPVAVSLPQAPLGTTTSLSSRASRVLAGTTATRTPSGAVALHTAAARTSGTTGPAAGPLHGGPTSFGGPVQQGPISLPTAGGHTGPPPSHCPASGCTATPPSVPSVPPVSRPIQQATGRVHKVVKTVKGVLPGHLPGTGTSSPKSTVHHVTGTASGAASSAGKTAHKTTTGARSTIHKVLP